MILKIEKIIKKYKKKKILNNISFKVSQGEIIGILGSNGSGKTTIFQIIIGIIKPNSGSIYLNKKNITKFPIYKRSKNGIGYLSQEPFIFRNLTVKENIELVLEIKKEKKEKKKIKKILQKFNIEKIKNNLGKTLSGGERKKTEIARSIIMNPKFLILDEPFSGVDPIEIEKIKNNIIKFKQKGGGIIITDHNINEILSITNKLYFISKGKIIKSGNSKTIIKNKKIQKKYLGKNFKISGDRI